jgi:hypothetical protein
LEKQLKNLDDCSYNGRVVNMFNAKMKKENKNVIFFVNNIICHPKVTLSNAKIVWFPANATSVLQPKDMGVIYTFKLHYRRFLMQF